MSEVNSTPPESSVHLTTWVLGRCRECGRGALEPIDGRALGVAVIGIAIELKPCTEHDASEVLS